MLVFKTMRGNAVIALLAVSLAACTDGLTAPSPTFDPSDALMAKGSGKGTESDNSARGKDAGTRTFTIWPGAAVLEKFGDHVLTMPANVVCDPATSGYGPSFWDAPCARAKQPIEVTATWSTKSGRAIISFSPDLRFVPSSHERDWVNLWLRDARAVNPDLYYTILWLDKSTGRWVDESQTDPTLQARLYQGNLVTRRLKHFSDYTLWAGFGSYNVTSGLGGDAIGIGGW